MLDVSQAFGDRAFGETSLCNLSMVLTGAISASVASNTGLRFKNVASLLANKLVEIFLNLRNPAMSSTSFVSGAGSLIVCRHWR